MAFKNNNKYVNDSYKSSLFNKKLKLEIHFMIKS